ncbi:MAG TPA: hypothetical protein VF571_14840 [Pyrinomonadaceae bacterium]|jgi:hypothetical protein
MQMHFMQLNGITKTERFEMLDRLKKAIAASNGWITDFHQFSNFSVCINFEIELKHVSELRSLLLETKLNLDEKSLLLLDELSNQAAEKNGTANKEILGTLQISFIHNEPDLRIEVPPIPG